jgi:hypothetical protein
MLHANGSKTLLAKSQNQQQHPIITTLMGSVDLSSNGLGQIGSVPPKITILNNVMPIG